jgi:hypothetical protein
MLGKLIVEAKGGQFVYRILGSRECFFFCALQYLCALFVELLYLLKRGLFFCHCKILEVH